MALNELARAYFTMKDAKDTLRDAEHELRVQEEGAILSELPAVVVFDDIAVTISIESYSPVRLGYVVSEKVVVE